MKNRFHTLNVLIIIYFAVFFFGCAQKTESSGQNQELEKLRQENKKQAAELARKDQIIASMQLKLLEEHAEVDRLTRMNEHLISDFVRNKPTTRNRGDKAETVRLIAEVDTLINTLKDDNAASRHHDVLGRAEKYLVDSKSELDVGNIDGSFYLANQALEQVQEAQLIAEATNQSSGGAFITFSVPLPMKLSETSNIRSGPSINNKVLFILGTGEAVNAVGYQGEWIKVRVEGRESGWIHSSLLN